VAKRRDKAEERSLARRRVDDLLAAAGAELRRDPAGPLPARYGRLALRVAERYQSGLTPAQKARLCRKCGALRTAATSRTRLRGGRVATTCLVCGHVQRRPLAPASRPVPASGER
jgi:RNase P subunit RPR2